MKIACLGWGSLIWNPEELQIQSVWFNDGPLIPIEFTRESENGRITLVIDKLSKPVRSLWTLMTTDDFNEARDSLRKREGTNQANIHYVRFDEETNDEVKSIIKKWLIEKNIDSAIWTGLTSKFNGNDIRPTIEQVINHLSKLDFKKWKLAQEYICRAPKQIDTEYRRLIEKELGWTPAE